MTAYPNIDRLGIAISTSASGIEYVAITELDRILPHESERGRFGHLFGVQACLPEGLYPWTVEPVLEQMQVEGISSDQKKIGTKA